MPLLIGRKMSSYLTSCLTVILVAVCTIYIPITSRRLARTSEAEHYIYRNILCVYIEMYIVCVS
jgi:hypothetical protein